MYSCVLGIQGTDS